MHPHHYYAKRSTEQGGLILSDNWTTQFRKGLLELCVLLLLKKQEAYAYELLVTLGQRTSLGITESTLYPLLARLEREGYLTVRIAPSASGPNRRYYRLVALGEQHLVSITKQWKSVSQSVSELLSEG